jgi:hypothetical protein
MYATVIIARTRDAEYRNLVIHECSLGEFINDLQREIREFTKDKKVSKIDIFWHVDEYCTQKYGRCPWQMVTIDSLLPKLFLGILEEG